MIDPRLVALAERAGIHFMGVNAGFQKPEAVFATDAQPELITTSNAGIPAFLSTFIDPKLIKIIIAPNKAVKILGEGSEVKKGDWTTDTAMFHTVESTGEVASYGDYSNEGKSGVNTTYPERQAYHYQTMTMWGERELERAGLGRIDLANQLNIASVSTLNKFQNKSYFFGVAGLKNYGLLNDPSLTAPITPTVDTTVSGNPTTWALKSALGIYADILALFTQLQTQTNSLSIIEQEDPMVLALSSNVSPNLSKVTQYNVNVRKMITDNFPNLRIETAPEYATSSGNLVQLIVDAVDGQKTAELAFTEKLRAHPIVIEASSFKQKKSQGTFGSIIYQPNGIAQMLGV